MIYKTVNKFSALAIDHAHEQNNSLVKSVGVLLALQKSGSFATLDGCWPRNVSFMSRV